MTDVAAHWHDVECGAYAADLALWSELAREAAGPVAELGAGTGRVALHLARTGLELTAVDSDPRLLDELERRARAEGLAITTAVADARRLDLETRFAAILAPMQLVHLLGGADGRAAMLGAALAHLEPGGTLAAALLSEPGVSRREQATLAPDVREIDGWVYSSQPLEVVAIDGGFEVRRLRQLVSPTGELSEELDSVHLDRLEPEEFEAEALAAGFELRERVVIAPTPDHVGSVVCALEVAR